MEPISRRSIVAAAWVAPVIVAASAAPAVAASTPPPIPVCVDPDGLVIKPVFGQNWKTNQGEGFTTVDGNTISIENNGPYDTIHVPITIWTSAHEDGVRLQSYYGDKLLDVPKDGNRASVMLTITKGTPFLVQVVAPIKDAEAHLIVGCDRGFILKSSR